MNNISTSVALTRNRKLALAGAFSALIIVLSLTNLGFISFSPVVSITILQIPVILCATMAGLPAGLFAGFVMCMMSLIKSAMSPSGILDPFFVNPMCSVLPRMFLGLVALDFSCSYVLLYFLIPLRQTNQINLRNNYYQYQSFLINHVIQYCLNYRIYLNRHCSRFL